MQFSRKALVFLSAGVCCAPAAVAQNYPNKQITIVSTTAGGGADTMARLAAVAITQNLGQSAVVVNRPGNVIGPAMQVVKAAPDGYTLLSLGGNLLWLYPFLADDVPYDPVRDLTPVTLTARSPNIVVVHSSVPATNIRELIALAKAKPGTLNVGTSNPGGSPHLAGELFKAMSQIPVVTVPYKGTLPALNAVLSGEIHLLFPTVSTGMPGVKTGKIRALAVTTDRPSVLAPGLATVNKSGIPGYESSAAYVVFAPAKTPAAIVNTLNQAIVKHHQSPEVKQKMFGAGLDIVGSSPQELAAAMKQDMERMGKIIRENGIRAEE